MEFVVIDTKRGLPVVSTPSLSGRSFKSSREKKRGDSQSAVPVLEEPIGTTFAIDELHFASVGGSVDESGQEDDGEGESASENHHGRRRVKAEEATGLLLTNTWTLIRKVVLIEIDQVVSPNRHLHSLMNVKAR